MVISDFGPEVEILPFLHILNEKSTLLRTMVILDIEAIV